MELAKCRTLDVEVSRPDRSAPRGFMHETRGEGNGRGASQAGQACHHGLTPTLHWLLIRGPLIPGLKSKNVWCPSAPQGSGCCLSPYRLHPFTSPSSPTPSGFVSCLLCAGTRLRAFMCFTSFQSIVFHVQVKKLRLKERDFLSPITTNR